MDPLAPDYPELTPYQFASNTPIRAIDLDGLEGWEVNGVNIHGPYANTNAASLELYADQLLQLNDLLSNNQNLIPENTGYGEIELQPESQIESESSSSIVKVLTKKGLGIISILLTPANGYQLGGCQGIPIENCPELQENRRYRESFYGSLESLYKGVDLFTNPENWHHVIPQKFRPGRAGMHPIVEAAINGGFDFDAALGFNGEGNQIPLEGFRKKNGEGQHNGGHPKYNEMIKEKLDQFQEDNWDGSTESAKGFLQGLVKEIVQQIANNPGKKLDDIDF